MSIAITEKARQMAKRDGLHLAKITLDGKHLKAGRTEMSGAVSHHIKHKIEALILEWTKEASKPK